MLLRLSCERNNSNRLTDNPAVQSYCVTFLTYRFTADLRSLWAWIMQQEVNRCDFSSIISLTCITLFPIVAAESWIFILIEAIQAWRLFAKHNLNQLMTCYRMNVHWPIMLAGGNMLLYTLVLKARDTSTEMSALEVCVVTYLWHLENVKNIY